MFKNSFILQKTRLLHHKGLRHTQLHSENLTEPVNTLDKMQSFRVLWHIWYELFDGFQRNDLIKYPNFHEVLRHREEFCQPAIKFLTFRSLDKVTTKWGKKIQRGNVWKSPYSQTVSRLFSAKMNFPATWRNGCLRNPPPKKNRKM
jgi:hypothetical protein